jgi:hypothetical protein
MISFCVYIEDLLVSKLEKYFLPAAHDNSFNIFPVILWPQHEGLPCDAATRLEIKYKQKQQN